MSVFRLFNFSTNKALGCRNVLCSRHILKICEGQSMSSLSDKKILKKLGLPLPPKRPLSPYNRFLREERQKIDEGDSSIERFDIKTVAKKWSQCDPERKKLLEKEYLSDIETYLKDLEKYKKSITPEQRHLIESTKEKYKRTAEIARLHEKRESLGAPKRPKTMFFKFLEEKKAERPAGMKMPDWIKCMVQEWNEVPQEKKDIYKEEADKAMAKYKAELLEWEENMLRQGHSDLVRGKILTSGSK